MSTPKRLESVEQDQIDQLIRDSGEPGGAARTKRQARPEDLQIYDFRRPNRVSKGRLRTLEVMYERLGKGLEAWLTARIRGNVELRFRSAEQISFGEYSLFLTSPCCSYLVSIKDAGGQQGVIDFGTELAFFLVDRLLGGAGEPTILERALTPIERMALRVVAERVASQLEETWREQEDLEMSIDGFESVPETMSAVDREDPVLVVTFSATFCNKTSVLSICLPLGVLEKFFVVRTSSRRGNLSSLGSEKELLANRTNTETQIRATSVPFRVRLPDFRVSMRDLANLQVGTVLPTGVPADGGLLAFVGATPRFICSAGWVGRTLSVQVQDTIDAPSQGANTIPTP
ncbi:MAG: FliM/FliN family flagellar motor switch protein [bacterium]